MKTKQLSPSQLAVLAELAKPGACAWYMPHSYFNKTSYYFLSTTHKPCTAQIRSLVKHGLAEEYDHNPVRRQHKIRITAAGREMLK